MKSINQSATLASSIPIRVALPPPLLHHLLTALQVLVQERKHALPRQLLLFIWGFREPHVLPLFGALPSQRIQERMSAVGVLEVFGSGLPPSIDLVRPVLHGGGVRKPCIVVQRPNVNGDGGGDVFWLGQLGGGGAVEGKGAVDVAVLGSCQGQSTAHAPTDGPNLRGAPGFEVLHCLLQFFHGTHPVEVFEVVGGLFLVDANLAMVDVRDEAAIALGGNLLGMAFDELWYVCGVRG